jgi:hypothetical protein
MFPNDAGDGGVLRNAQRPGLRLALALLPRQVCLRNEMLGFCKQDVNKFPLRKLASRVKLSMRVE